MAHTQRTFLLDSDWDISLDEAGNIRLASGAYATAQNCANEIRLWRDDAYFAADSGIAWAEVQLAQKLSESAVVSVLREACMNVDGVASVEGIEIDGIDGTTRSLSGEVTITTDDGETATTEF